MPWLVPPLYRNQEKQRKIRITTKNTKLKVNPGTDNSIGQWFRAKVKQNIRTELSVSPRVLSFQLVSSVTTQEARDCECVSQYVVYLVNLSKSALNSYLQAQH